MTEQTPGSDRPHQSPDQGQGPQSGSPWPHQPAAGAGHPGDLGKRFVARLIDGILVGIVYGIISFIIGALIQPSGVVAPGQAAGAAWLSTFVTAVITVAINLGYFTFMESSRGQTLGKMALSLRVHGPSGGHPTLLEALKRNVWLATGILVIIPVVGGFLSGIGGLVAVIVIAVGINNDTVTRKGWHDSFAGGTRVVTTQ